MTKHHPNRANRDGNRMALSLAIWVMKRAMRITTISILIVILCTAAIASYKFRGIKVEKVEIIAPGQLYANYEFSAEELNTISVAVDGDKELLDEIDAYHVEQGWPDPLGDFSWRIDHGSVISQFEAYKICEISEGKCLLVVPLEKNRKLTEVVLMRDIYFVMKTDAVK